jgi:hypothetical protein
VFALVGGTSVTAEAKRGVWTTRPEKEGDDKECTETHAA